jgi:transcriptional regulator with XRE-family HTH domain
VNIIQYELVKATLRGKGITFASIAAHLGVHRTQPTAVLKGRITSARIQKEIADRLGVSSEGLGQLISGDVDSLEQLFQNHRTAA